MAPSYKRPEILVIAGPTASGKSDLALKIAKEFNGEIISADSWTVYKGFDIGTSKPSNTDQQAVEHHLLDVTDAKKGFNAPKFKKFANQAIAEIHNRGKLPIIVGGTGLYLDSVLYDFEFLPTGSLEERAKLNGLTIKELIAEARAKKIDLAGIDTRNKRRIIRAIEAGGQKPNKQPLRESTLLVGINPGRKILKENIEKRIDKMLESGLETEVKKLAAKYGWDNEPMKGIGYRQWQFYFNGKQNLAETRTRIVSSSMNLAKRQMTWLKRNPDIKWFESTDEAFDYLTKTLASR